MKLLFITLAAILTLYAQPVEAKRSFRCRHGQMTLRFPGARSYGCIRRAWRPTQYRFAGRWRRSKTVIPAIRNRNPALYPRTYRLR